MPEIFRFYGFSFFFYSREHEPIHVHVEGAEGFAKYNYTRVRDKKSLVKVGNLVKNSYLYR
ncbi:Uncharacterised protein [Prevotella melaninogenica]|uniref:DUF4160 domain-containing protein n=1 Tax=Prevotella melaninogenica TaxID=28132 RepID=UPI001957D51F|nr:DUF4160 domain-containing protein [Prevotella melaninogenica]VTY10646.1 Uncharacterised protein [Prevotella melaninogenica]